MTISFEDIPYEGRPIESSRPERAAVEAWLQGIDVQHPGRARVLELGCAEGANLAPFAYHCPGSTYVGVDASPRHIESALARRDRLGLDNLEFHVGRIEALPDEIEGRFDYILCHGVLSWVPADVREAIFGTLRDRLTPSGVGYVSYNVGPGWAMRGLVRQVLLARTKNLGTPAERMAEARELLGFLANSPLSDHPYGEYMAQEAASLLEHRDPYIAHDYLADDNYAFTYGEIDALARAADLTFLYELSPIMHRGLEERMRDVIDKITDGQVEREELTDVLYGRAFRASLFVRNGAPRDPDAGRERLFVQAGLVTGLGPMSKRPSLADGDAEEFEDRNGVRLSVTHPVLKAALLELARSFPLATRFDDLVDRAWGILQLRRVRPLDQDISADAREKLREDMLRLVRLEHIELRLTPPEIVAKAGGLPRATSLARDEGRHRGWASTAFHEALQLDDAARYLLDLLDGSRDRAQLAEQLLATLTKHDVQVQTEDGETLEGDAAQRAMERYVERYLLLFEAHGLLER